MADTQALRDAVAAAPADAGAHFRLGCQLFKDKNYAEAKATLEKAKGLADAASDTMVAKSSQTWIRKCDTHLVDEPPGLDAPEGVTAAVVEKAAEPPAPAPAKKVAPPPPLVRSEWFQTLNNVTLTYYVKGLKPEDVAVESTKRSFAITIKLADGKEFQASHDPLFGEVNETPVVDVRSVKVEVTLTKATTGLKWPTLEMSAEDQEKGIAKPATNVDPTAPASYPNSKGRDWSKFALQEEEADVKPSGDEALNKLFKDIYGNANDDVRRAMMKSYQESGGTVLSTNWADVGSKTVTGDPPKGMERRKWNE